MSEKSKLSEEVPKLLTSYQLKSIYNKVKGVDFNGELLDEPYNEYGKEWTMIQVKGNEPVVNILQEIEGQVQGQVWKGFTGHADGYDSYRLFVDFIGDHKACRGRFKVTNVETISVTKRRALYPSELGVAMTVDCT